MLRGRVLPRKFEKIHNWAKPSPRYNPAIMHRTKITTNAYGPWPAEAWVGAGTSTTKFSTAVYIRRRMYCSTAQ